MPQSATRGRDQPGQEVALERADIVDKIRSALGDIIDQPGLARREPCVAGPVGMLFHPIQRAL